MFLSTTRGRRARRPVAELPAWPRPLETTKHRVTNDGLLSCLFSERPSFLVHASGRDSASGGPEDVRARVNPNRVCAKATCVEHRSKRKKWRCCQTAAARRRRFPRGRSATWSPSGPPRPTIPSSRLNTSHRRRRRASRSCTRSSLRWQSRTLSSWTSRGEREARRPSSPSTSPRTRRRATTSWSTCVRRSPALDTREANYFFLSRPSTRAGANGGLT